MFLQLQKENNIPIHDGRPLWKYNLKENHYKALKQSLSETKFLGRITAIDCALYYALWWQYGYNGGKAGKFDVFSSFYDNHRFDEEEFYQKAKEGGRKLNFKWIRHNNTLYFRTLLFQGGAPKLYCNTNGGIYTNFLLNLSVSNPRDIYAIDNEYLDALPKSLRENEDFLEFCLNICSNPEDFKEFIPDEETLGKISANKKKRTVTLRSPFNFNWLLDIEEASIHLEIETPLIQTEEAIKHLLNDYEPTLQKKYALYIDDEFLVDYVQLNNGSFKQNNKVRLKKAFTQGHLFKLEIIGYDGSTYNCSNIISFYPDLENPSFWSELTDTKFKLEKGTTTTKEKAIILAKKCPADHSCKSFEYEDQAVYYMECTNDICLKIDDEEYTFRTNFSPFYWEMSSYTSPAWIKRSSLPIIQTNPRFKVYNDEDQEITAEIAYKARNRFQWKPYTKESVLPIGIVDFKISADENSQTTQVFNSSKLSCKQTSNGLRHSAFQFSDNRFDVQFYETDKFQGSVDNNLLTLELTGNKIPSSVKFRMKTSQQNKSVLFYMDPYFSGVELTNNLGEKVEEEQTIFLKKLKGFRLFVDKDHEYSYKLYNEDNPNIFKRIKIQKSISSLIPLEEQFDYLFALTSPIEKGTTITIAIEKKTGEHEYKEVKSFKLKKFTSTIDPQNLENIIGKSIIAIPLSCPLEKINTFKVKTESVEAIRASLNETGETHFLIYEKEGDHVCSHTDFLTLLEPSTNTENNVVENSFTRVKKHTQILLSATPNDEIWQKVLSHYRICLAEGLPFSTFETLRAIVENSALIPKYFFFLMINNQEEQFAPSIWKKLETELGFSALWIPVSHWNDAIDWILDFYKNPVLLTHIGEKFNNTFSTYPEFNAYTKIQNAKKIELDFHLKAEIKKVRANLGIKAIQELPNNTSIKVIDKTIISVDQDNPVKILLETPVAIAESMLGKSTDLWGYTIEQDKIRRAILYCQQIQTERTDIYSKNIIYNLSEWFEKATLYAVSKLKK